MKIAYLRPHGTWWAVVGLLPKEWQFTASGWQDAVLAVNTRAEQEGIEVQLQHHGRHTLSRPGETEPADWRDQLGLTEKLRITVRTTPSVRAWLEETYPRGRRSAAICGLVRSAARADALRTEDRTERIAVHIDAATVAAIDAAAGPGVAVASLVAEVLEHAWRQALLNDPDDLGDG